MRKGLGTYTHAALLLKSRLETRLKKLKEFALQDIKKLTEDLARQDKRQAAKVKGKLEARLDATCTFFDGLPPQKYDRNISERITEILPQQAPPADCEWLSTPVRASLESGTAQLALTVRREAVCGRCGGWSSVGRCSNGSLVLLLSRFATH